MPIKPSLTTPAIRLNWAESPENREINLVSSANTGTFAVIKENDYLLKTKLPINRNIL